MRCEKAGFAVPYRFGIRLYRLRVFVFQLPFPLASCSSTPCFSETSAPCRKIPANFRQFVLTHYTVQCEKAWFAVPYRFWHCLYRLRVFISQLPVPLVSCSSTLCISATSASWRKIPANFRKFALMALFGAVREGWVCSPVQVWTPFVPTAGFHISTPHPLSFMF